MTRSFTKSSLNISTWEHSMSLNRSFLQMIAENQNFPQMTRIHILIQAEAHKVLQSDSTQTIDHIQKCFRQKFQWSRRPSYWTTLFLYRWRRWSYLNVNPTFSNGTMYFFSMTLLPILRRIQRPITQGHSGHAKYENSRKIILISFHFLRYPWQYTSIGYCWHRQ